jgi:hypothetical protein
MCVLLDCCHPDEHAARLYATTHDGISLVLFEYPPSYGVVVSGSQAGCLSAGWQPARRCSYCTCLMFEQCCLAADQQQGDRVAPYAWCCIMHSVIMIQSCISTVP